MAFTFMSSMIKKDMNHLLVDAMKKEDSIRMYQEIQEHFKGFGSSSTGTGNRTRSVKTDGAYSSFGEGATNANAGVTEIWNTEDNNRA